MLPKAPLMGANTVTFAAGSLRAPAARHGQQLLLCRSHAALHTDTDTHSEARTSHAAALQQARQGAQVRVGGDEGKSAGGCLGGQRWACLLLQAPGSRACRTLVSETCCAEGIFASLHL